MSTLPRKLAANRKWRKANPEKARAIGEAWRRANRESAWGSSLKSRFNMTVEVYARIFLEQGGLCKICKNPETHTLKGKVVRLAVDHNHACCPEKGRSCGKCIRGLLCHACNTSLGGFKDDPTLLRAAADYLEGP